jgi:glutamine amidotransferase
MFAGLEGKKMCRFVVYKGREMFMSDLLTKSEQSLIRQSFKARERKEPLNGDGFGVGWYTPDVDATPCVFTSITPAWSNRNLHHLAEKIRSGCFFAHVRAATSGLLVSEVNCHPFQYRQFLWMHNGSVGQFDKIKRRLRESLADEVYNFIQGTTDSEHTFAVFLNEMLGHLEDYSTETLQEAVLSTIHRLDTWTREAGVDRSSYYNFALTDGNSTIVSRYVSNPNDEAATLYISSGERFESHEGVYHMVPSRRDPQAIIIASEPLTDTRSDWQPVPKNHLITITPELHIQMTPIQ